MGIIGGCAAYWFLYHFYPGDKKALLQGDCYKGTSKIETLVGQQVWREIQDKVIIDFGCGRGDETIELAQHGAKRVIGIDIRENVLATARNSAERAKVSDRCVFATQTTEMADVIICLDAFEHFDDPAGILQTLSGLIKPSGRVIISFGPPWYHPLGGHLFSVFPWAHLIFTERALIRWRSDFKSDGATRFNEVEGGLNEMTIRRFRRLVEKSPFCLESFEAKPIKRLRFLHTILTQELFTSIVQCRLILKNRISH